MVSLTRLRLRPTSRVECPPHSGWFGSLVDAFHTTVNRGLARQVGSRLSPGTSPPQGTSGARDMSSVSSPRTPSTRNVSPSICALKREWDCAKPTSPRARPHWQPSRSSRPPRGHRAARRASLHSQPLVLHYLRLLLGGDS